MISGLKLGEKVVTKGSFTLKTQNDERRDGGARTLMINALIRFSVSQRLLVLLMVAIMVGAGALQSHQPSH